MTNFFKNSKNSASKLFKNHPKKIVIIFFAFILLIGFCNYKSYGISWDEYLENNILQSNVASYVDKFAGGEGLSSLDLTQSPQISTYNERDHGQSMYYLFSPVNFIFKDDINTIYTLKHLYTFLIFFGGLVCLYLVILNLTKRRILAILGVLLVFLSPRMFAESFYNSKDIVLMSMIIVSFYFGYKFIEKKTFVYGIVFALAMALTSNTRIIGFWLFGIVGALYLAMLIKDMIEKKKFAKTFFVGVTAVIAFVVFFIALTPASWTSPIEYFNYTYKFSLNFSRWDGIVLYMGDTFNNKIKPLPWHYIPVMFAVTTPIVTVLLVIFGIFDSVRATIVNKLRNFLNGAQKYYILLLIFTLMPLITAIVKNSNIYNGWRHFYFIFGALIILAVGGVFTLLKVDNKIFKRIFVGVISLQLAFSGIWIALNSGVQYAYFNPLAINSEKNFETDYWNVSVSNCLIKFLDSTSQEQVKISAVDWYSFEGLGQAKDYLPKEYSDRIVIIPMERRIYDNAEYLISNTSYQNLTEVSWDKNMNTNKPYSFENTCNLYTSIVVNGHSIMNIYKYKL